MIYFPIKKGVYVLCTDYTFQCHSNRNYIFSVSLCRLMDDDQICSTSEYSKKRRRLKGIFDIGNVDEYELELTSLTAHTCREINAQSQERINSSKQKMRKKQRPVNSNNAFFVKSDDSCTCERLGIAKVSNIYPSTMCPNINNHLHNIFVLKHELPLACPTCWSLQRNSKV